MIRKTIVLSGYLFSALVLVTGLLVVITYLLTINLNHHRADLEKSVSAMLNRTITFQRVTVGWYHYYYPEIDLEQVAAIDDQTQQPKLSIQRLRMNFNIWDSLLHWQIIIRNITLSGIDITVSQEDSGLIKIGNLISFNMRDQSTGALLQPNQLMNWILTQRRLSLEDIRFHLIIPKQPQRDIHLNKFVLRNSLTHHLITGDITLMQKKPAALSVNFDWDGDIHEYLIATGKLQLNLKNLSLAKWIGEINYEGFQVKKGSISGTLIIDWKNNQWSTAEIKCGVTNITVQGSTTPLSIHVDQVSTNLNLRQDTKIIAEGNIVVKNGNIVASNNPLSLTNVNGTLTLSDTGVTADNITALLVNEPATMNISMNNKEPQEVLINLASQISVPKLESILNVSLSTIMQGTLNYQAKLTLSRDASKSNLIMMSDLKGVSINAPENLGKTADQTKNLQMTLAVSDASSFTVKSRYDKNVTAALTFKKSNENISLASGEIRLGSGEAQLQKTAGLVISVNTPTLNVDTWKNYLDSFKTSSNRSNIRSLDLTANTVLFSGQELHKAHIKAIANNQSWQVNVASTEIGGDLTVPATLANNTLVGRFQYLRLQNNNSKTRTASFNPSELPALSLTADDVQIGEYHLGHVILNTAPKNHGMLIKQLAINESFLKLDASGDWTGSETRLQGNISSNNVNDMLKNLGFNVTNFLGSSADLQFNLNWNGPAYSPSLSNLNGKFSLKLGPGMVTGLSDSTNAKIGLANLLNLFSLSALPGLNLNPDHSSERGYGFQSVSGNFDLRGGSAYTNDLVFVSSIAGIAIKGRIGLGAKDYDLQMGVSPHITGSLPLVTTLAGGPLVGLAAWAVTQVVSGASSASSSSTYQYNVKGPWSNPEMTKIGR